MMVAVTLPVLLGFAALTIDIGQALVARNELQDVADAAALAGARRMGTIYQSLTPAQQVSYTMTNPAPIYLGCSKRRVPKLWGWAINYCGCRRYSNRSVERYEQNVDSDDCGNPDAVRVTARLDGTTQWSREHIFSEYHGH